ncbi:MAG: phage protease [Pseudomonadota bacterium]
MARPALISAVLAPLALSVQAAAHDVHWVNILPAPTDGQINTIDSRGPYTVEDAAALVRASMERGRLPIDENHSIDIAAKEGKPSPAVGHIEELQAREDGSIWGRVTWNRIGTQLIEDDAYSGISPVFMHDQNNVVHVILRASLTNTPNLRGMTALHSEEGSMELLAKLAGMLGLDEGATEDDVMAAIEKMSAKKDDEYGAATQAQIDAIASALGKGAGTSVDDLVAAAQSVAQGGDAKDATITALQSKVDELDTGLKAEQSARARDTATAYVDGEMKKGRAGLNATVRDKYIDMHMADPASATTLIEAMPIIGEGRTPLPQPKPALQSNDPQMIAAKARKYIATQAAEGVTIDIATAIQHIEEGKVQ